MKSVKELITGIGACKIYGSDEVEVHSLGMDSRAVEPGGMFFAIRGTSSDGHAYIDAAIGRGAVAVVCEEIPSRRDDGVTYIVVADSAAAMGHIAAAFYGHPSRRLKLVGVTGTNGKTTTVTLLYELFRRLGYRAGLISTVVYRIGDREIEATHTTPDAIRLQEMIAGMVDEGCDYCFMEVSSHSVVQHRIGGLTFAGGIFTNITLDHLDYHGTMAEYIRAKKMFFDTLPREAFALVNVDDRNGRVMVQNTKAAVKTFSMREMADYRCRIVEKGFGGMLLNIDSTEVWVRLIGGFNAYNLLGIYGAAMSLGQKKEEVLTALSTLEAVSGRFEYLRSPRGVTAIVDYAHTPDALQNVIDTINDVISPGQNLYVVVGCGGNRDRTKRPVMARIAVEGSRMAILTSDNPRRERPEDILQEMRDGLKSGDRYLVIADRREAIRTAASLAGEGDVILIAGKGHETYQEIDGVRHHFDDKEEISRIFAVE